MRLAALAATALLALSGCFQSDLVVRVEPDGSGTLEQTIHIAQATLDTIAQFGDSSAVLAFEELFDEDSLRAQAARYGEGVRFVSATPTEGDGLGGRVVYAFADVARLRVPISNEDALGGEAMAAEGPEEPDYITFEFDPSTSLLSVHMPHERVPSEPVAPLSPAAADSVRMEIGRVAMMAQMLGDTGIRIALEAPGGIVQTDARFRSGHRVTLLDLSITGLLADTDLLLGLQAYDRAGYGPFETLAALQDSSSAVAMEPQPTITLQLARE